MTPYLRELITQFNEASGDHITQANMFGELADELAANGYSLVMKPRPASLVKPPYHTIEGWDRYDLAG